MKVFKFVTEEYKSPLDTHQPIDYSPSYTKVIEEEDCDPREKGLSIKDIHVIPFIDNPDFANVIFSSKIIIGEANYLPRR